MDYINQFDIEQQINFMAVELAESESNPQEPITQTLIERYERQVQKNLALILFLSKKIG